MNIKKYIPLKIKQMIIEHMSRKDVYEEKYNKENKKIIITVAADYGNLGDIAITYAQKKFLEEHYKGYDIIEIPISKTYENLKSLKKIVGRQDIITIIGGGNLGNLYEEIEGMRQTIIKKFPDNKIISFPQTIDFTSNKEGEKKLKKAVKIYGKHKKLFLFARENKSLALMKKYFKKNQVFLAPDIVLSLNKLEPLEKREYITLCLRNDKENKINSTDKKKLEEKLKEKYNKKILIRDTHLGNVRIDERNREKYLLEIWNDFKRSKVVLTDRLHGMIFCTITGTPCIVFPNSNGKIESTYNTWLKDIEYIKLMNNIKEKEIFKQIECLKNNQNSFEIKNFAKEYKKILEIIDNIN